MNVRDSINLKVSGKDYKDLGEKFVIYNVPIAAELVQPYTIDGEVKWAFKPRKELQKIVVDNIPVTMRADEPSHPEFLSLSNTDEKADVVVGLMSEPSKPKKDADNKKRYADMILFKSSLTQRVIDKYLMGEVIDTSMGFNYDADMNGGSHDGVKYDFVQRNIKLDHNTILLDAMGRQGMGRMPSPIGGIGADSMNDKDAFEAELNTLIADLRTKNAALSDKDIITLLRDAMWKKENTIGGDKVNAEELKKSLDAVTAERDTLLKQTQEAKDAANKDADAKLANAQKAKDEVEAQLKKATDKLAVFEKKEKDEADAMREELKKATPGMDKLFVEAKDDLIREYHAELRKKQAQKGRDVGADMMGATKNTQTLDDRQKTMAWVDEVNKAREKAK